MSMTEQEAIKAIENDLEWHSKELKPKYKEVLKIAIKALEKQIPKKPLIEYHCVLQRLCPTCNCEVSDIEHRKWSCNCGQKLDWE